MQLAKMVWRGCEIVVSHADGKVLFVRVPDDYLEYGRQLFESAQKLSRMLHQNLCVIDEANGEIYLGFEANGQQTLWRVADKAASAGDDEGEFVLEPIPAARC